MFGRGLGKRAQERPVEVESVSIVGKCWSVSILKYNTLTPGISFIDMFVF